MRRRTQFHPYIFYDAMGFIRQTRLAAEQEGDTVRAVCWETSKDHVFSVELGEGLIGPIGGGTRYVRAEGDSKQLAAGFKLRALQYGATPEAIRLLRAIVPMKQEEITMATEKLKGKGAANTDKKGKATDPNAALETTDAKAARKAALKEAAKGEATSTPAKAARAAKNKPAAEGDAPKKRGNVEALQKAREARKAAGPDNRKIKIVNKENPYRAESNRAAAFSALKGAKTVGDYLENGGKTKYLSRWVEEGRIELV